jgi:CelD/BcsL family acetyltransferase involved in cellulose biosynthesis
MQVYTSVDALPERVTAFVDATAKNDFFRSLAWFRTVLATAGRHGDEGRVYVAEIAGQPIAALIGSERHGAGILNTTMFLGAGQGIYAVTFAPVLDPELGDAGLTTIVSGLARQVPRLDVLRFDGLDPCSVDFSVLWRALRRSGMLLQRFANLNIWTEEVGRAGIAEYMAGRPASIREWADGGSAGLASSMRFECVADGVDLARPLVDYALVDVQSSRAHEPYPDCTPALARAAAARGLLRLGLLYFDDQPVAAQIWIVSGGTATIWRERHAACIDGLPLQAKLTAMMLSSLFETHRIRRIEFSRDTAEIAPAWAGVRRERVGVIACNPRSGKGWLAAARHIGGHAAMSTLRRMYGATEHGGRR